MYLSNELPGSAPRANGEELAALDGSLGARMVPSPPAPRIRRREDEFHEATSHEVKTEIAQKVHLDLTDDRYASDQDIEHCAPEEQPPLPVSREPSLALDFCSFLGFIPNALAMCKVGGHTNIFEYEVDQGDSIVSTDLFEADTHWKQLAVNQVIPVLLVSLRPFGLSAFP